MFRPGKWTRRSDSFGTSGNRNATQEVDVHKSGKHMNGLYERAQKKGCCTIEFSITTYSMALGWIYTAIWLIYAMSLVMREAHIFCLPLHIKEGLRRSAKAMD